MQRASCRRLQGLPQRLGHGAPIVCDMLVLVPEPAEALLAIHSSHSGIHQVPGLQLIEQALAHSVGEATIGGQDDSSVAPLLTPGRTPLAVRQLALAAACCLGSLEVHRLTLLLRRTQ